MAEMSPTPTDPAASHSMLSVDLQDVGTRDDLTIQRRLDIVAAALFAMISIRGRKGDVTFTSSPLAQHIATRLGSQSSPGVVHHMNPEDALFFHALAQWQRLISRPRDSAATKFRLTVLALCQLRTNFNLSRRTTLRDMYYCLASVANHDQTRTNDAINIIAECCRCTREQFFVSASARGLLGGTLEWGSGPTTVHSLSGELASMRDFVTGFSNASDRERTVWAAAAPTLLADHGFVVRGPGLDRAAAAAYVEFVCCTENHACPRRIILGEEVRCILVVEKDTVFQRLLDGGLCKRVPCVMLTGRGIPDVATRAVLRVLSLLFPRLPVMALVDCNPSGLTVLAQFQFGGIRVRRRAALTESLAVGSIGWIGLLPSDIDAFGISGTCGMPMTPRDHALMQTLRDLAARRNLAQWTVELRLMGRSGFLKYDIESLYSALSIASQNLDLIQYVSRRLMEMAAVA